MLMSNLIHFFNKPLTALFIIIMFCIGFLVYDALTGNIDTKFVTFGPINDEKGNPVTFLGTKLDSWKTVIIAYLLIFFSAVFNTYYSNVIDHSLLSKITNINIINMPDNKIITYIITLIDPFIKTLLYIIEFYATATFQLQFILPQFLGAYITNLPFTLHFLKQKVFI